METSQFCPVISPGGALMDVGAVSMDVGAVPRDVGGASRDVKALSPSAILVILPSGMAKLATYCCRSSVTNAWIALPSAVHLGLLTGLSSSRVSNLGSPPSAAITQRIG